MCGETNKMPQNQEPVRTLVKEVMISVNEVMYDEAGRVIGSVPVSAMSARVPTLGSRQLISYREHQDDRPDPTAHAVEEFMASVGLPMPSRRVASKVLSERAQANDRHGEQLKVELARTLDARNALRDAQNELTQWRDFAIALEADRLARNFSISKKARSLDPRNDKSVR